MTAVWYVGSADERSISAAQWTAAGITGTPATNTWNASNGWSIPTSSFTAPQLAILAADGGFNTTAANGVNTNRTAVAGTGSATATASQSYVDSKDISQGSWDSGSPVDLMVRPITNPLRRQHTRPGRFGPVTTDITSFTINSTADGTLTKSYAFPTSGITSGQARLMTAGEIAALPIQCGAGRPVTYNSAGSAFMTSTPGSANIDGASVFPYIPLREIRTMSDGPKVDFLLYSPAQGDTAQIFIDGLPIQLLPLDPGFVNYIHLVFPSAKPRLIELRTAAFVGTMSTGALYKLWQPQAAKGPRVLFVGDSYIQPVVYNGTSGAAVKNGYGWAQQIADSLDIEDPWIEGIGGTGCIQRASGSVGGPNNNYLDRVAGHIVAKPDVLVVASAFANDMTNGNSAASAAANAHSWLSQLRAALPGCKFILINGWRAPLFGDYSTQFGQCIAALQALRQDCYYINATSMMDMAGYIPGHTTGTGNSDIYVGNDGVHLTVEGHIYARARLAPVIQRCIHDTGSVINTILAA